MANSVLYFILLVIVIVGALNWGFISLNDPANNPEWCGGFVGKIFKDIKHQRIVYGVVGVSGLLLIGLTLIDHAEKKKQQ